MHALECGPGPGCTSWICNNWTAGLTAAIRSFGTQSVVYTGLYICCPRMGWACMCMCTILSICIFFYFMHVRTWTLHVYVVCQCVVVCRCFNMQSKSPAPECNVSLVGSHARMKVNSGSTVTQPFMSSGFTPLNAGQAVQSQNQCQIFINPARQANTVVPKL